MIVNLLITRARQKFGHSGTKTRGHANSDGTRVRRKFRHVGTRARGHANIEGMRARRARRARHLTDSDSLCLIYLFLCTLVIVNFLLCFDLFSKLKLMQPVIQVTWVLILMTIMSMTMDWYV